MIQINSKLPVSAEVINVMTSEKSESVEVINHGQIHRYSNLSAGSGFTETCDLEIGVEEVDINCN